MSVQSVYSQRRVNNLRPRCEISNWETSSLKAQWLEILEFFKNCRYNPLYDTPPTQRHSLMRPQGLHMAEIRGVLGNSSPIHLNPGMRNQQPPGGQRPLLTEPVLSPILTDTEISPLHRTGMGSAPGKNEPQFTKLLFIRHSVRPNPRFRIWWDSVSKFMQFRQ